MKKISAIVLAIALVLMMSVPFSASAASTFVAPTVDAEVGATEVVYTISYEQNDWIANGKVEIEYDAEKLELALPTTTDRNGNESIDAGKVSSLPTAVINDGEAGKIIIAFAGSGTLPETGDIAKLVFNLTDAAVAGDEIAIKVSTSEWIDDQGDDYAANVAAAEGKIVVKEKATEATTEATEPTTEATEATTVATEATTVATEAPTTVAPTTAAPTTKAPTTAGEATPWALLATVTMAGAALVVLSTKKSK